MASEQLTKTFEFARATAAEVFAKDGYHSAIFMIGTPDGKGVLVPTQWGSNDEKHFVVNAVKDIFKEVGGVYYVFVNEVWVATVDGENDKRMNIAPSKRSDRTEALMIYGEERGIFEGDRLH